MKVEVNNKKNFEETTNTWGLKNIQLKNEWANQEIKVEIKKYRERNDNENTTVQKLGKHQSSPRREVYSNTGLLQEARKISNTQPNLTPKGARKRTTNKAKNQKKKGNNKD